MAKTKSESGRVTGGINNSCRMLKPTFLIIVLILGCLCFGHSQTFLNGNYMGLEEMCWVHNGKKECMEDPQRPQDKWYHLTLLTIKGDSVLAGQSPITIYKGDTGWSASDGGFYSYKGTITRNGTSAIIKLNIVKCDYCGMEAARKNPKRFSAFPWTKNYKCRWSKNGFYINGYFFRNTRVSQIVKRIEHKSKNVASSKASWKN